MFSGFVALPPGTVISAPTHLVFRHYGIVSECGTVLSCSARVGHAAEETVEAFSGGKPWRVEKRPNDLPWWEVIARARSLAQRPYHLTQWNCESYVAACYGLPPRSHQVGRTLLIAFAGMLAFTALNAE